MKGHQWGLMKMYTQSYKRNVFCNDDVVFTVICRLGLGFDARIIMLSAEKLSLSFEQYI